MTEIKAKTIGRRTLSGADFPIQDVLYRDGVGRRRPVWIVARAVCNGAAEASERYQTRREAVAAL